MRKMLALILFSHSAILLWGQSFEGSVIYKTEYQFQISDRVARAGITEVKLRKQMKDEGVNLDSMKITYRQGDYIAYTSVKPAAWSIYKAVDHKIYRFLERAPDLCVVFDASIDMDARLARQSPTIVKLDTTAEINGLTCQVVQVKWKTGSCFEYWYNPDTLMVDPTLFRGYVYQGWAGYLQLARALPLKIVEYKSGVAIITTTLIAQRPEKVDPALFILPKLASSKEADKPTAPNLTMMRVVR